MRRGAAATKALFLNDMAKKPPYCNPWQRFRHLLENELHGATENRNYLAGTGV